MWLNFKLSSQNKIRSYFTRIRKFVLAVIIKIKDYTFKVVARVKNTKLTKKQQKETQRTNK